MLGYMREGIQTPIGRSTKKWIRTSRSIKKSLSISLAQTHSADGGSQEWGTHTPSLSHTLPPSLPLSHALSLSHTHTLTQGWGCIWSGVPTRGPQFISLTHALSLLLTRCLSLSHTHTHALSLSNTLSLYHTGVGVHLSLSHKHPPPPSLSHTHSLSQGWGCI